MAMNPRWYQDKLITGVREKWSQGHRNVLCVSPPRSGKTATAYWLSETIIDTAWQWFVKSLTFINLGKAVMFFAHREELVKQLAMTYADFGIRHRIMAPDDVVRNITHLQHKKYGKSFVDERSNVLIGSVQTILARTKKLLSFFPRVGLWMCDEAHHCLPDNQWGKVIALMPNALGIGFTATPARTDRKSLASSQGGVFDAMVKGVTARQLINEGFICDYRIIAPPSSIDRDNIRIGSKGDFTQKGLSEAKHESTITGDCVSSYLKYTPGQQAVVFAVDIAHAQDLTNAYRAAGVSAEMVSGKTPKTARKYIMEKFDRGVFNILVNVDLFGEGLDVHGIEVVIMARPTQSFVLYVQQFFRALTKGADKDKRGTIIDHAGNVGFFGKIFGLPDAYNGWTLESEERGRKSRALDDDDFVVRVTTCKGCFTPYEAVLPACPYCGHKDEPVLRNGPEHVEGNLVELDADTLALMRGEVERIDGDCHVPGHLVGTMAGRAIEKNHLKRKEGQATLRYNITLWAGYWKDRGACDSEIHRRFFARFGIDTLSAQALNVKKAGELSDRVDKSLRNLIAKDNNGEQ